MNQLGVFAKYWKPGEVKTRLASAIGDDAAASFYEASVRTLLSRFCRTADYRVLGFTPADHAEEFRQMAGISWELQPQVEGDLGQRMRAYFEQAFAAGASRVALLGSDSPTLPIEYVEQAFRDLEVYDVVLGPSSDGGYYLIGASHEVPPVFDGVEWGTENVLQQTGLLLRDHEVSWTALPNWYDVDHQEDLQRLHDELTTDLAHDADFNLLRQFA